MCGGNTCRRGTLTDLEHIGVLLRGVADQGRVPGEEADGEGDAEGQLLLASLALWGPWGGGGSRGGERAADVGQVGLQEYLEAGLTVHSTMWLQFVCRRIPGHCTLQHLWSRLLGCCTCWREK